MAPFFPSDRDRLLLAFANLASYGIATRDAYGEHATEAHAAIAADLRLRHPHGLGAYVFWTAPDDARSFDEYGRLIDELPLHIGGNAHRRGRAHRARARRRRARHRRRRPARAGHGYAHARLGHALLGSGAPPTSASFSVRVSCLMRHSRLRAARSDSSSHDTASSTGSRRAV